MTRFKGRRARLGGLVAVALGAARDLRPARPGQRQGRQRRQRQTTPRRSSHSTRRPGPLVDRPRPTSRRSAAWSRAGPRSAARTSAATVAAVTAFAAARPSRATIAAATAKSPATTTAATAIEPGDDNGGGDSSGPGPASSPAPAATTTTGSGANCTTADLVAGAAVEEVELDFEHGTVGFDEVELDRTPARAGYLASSQSGPTPMSTSSGGSSW